MSRKALLCCVGKGSLLCFVSRPFWTSLYKGLKQSLNVLPPPLGGRCTHPPALRWGVGVPAPARRCGDGHTYTGVIR